jgi:hypothetical protein
LLQSLAQSGAGLIAEALGGCGDVGPSFGHIAGLGWTTFDDCPAFRDVFDHGDQLVERGGAATAEVEDRERRSSEVCGRPDALDGIIDECVVALAGAVAIDGDWASLEDCGGEFADGEVRALARAVNGEEAEADALDAVQVSVV